ncbi:MAG: DNA-3-methyladenine glycosylase I [Candidatus Bathyarchaeia archaeon]
MRVNLTPEHWSPPDWIHVDKRPSSDSVYFENMCRIIFQAGLNWSVVEKKWLTTKKAFDNFSTEKVSVFTSSDIARLMKDEGIVRNKGKISSIIQNAKEFEKIKKEYGSFQKYLDKLDKSHNYSSVVKELTARFKWLGPSSASLFLYSVGEKIKHTM